jgi:IS30 family transposase
MCESDFEAIVSKVWPLIAKQGQSPSQVWATHSCKLPVSERTFYRYVSLGQGDMSKVHMPKACAYKPRRRHKGREAKELVKHTYADFCALTDEERASVVEMDCVEGITTDTKVLLTLLFKSMRMLFIFVLAEHTSACVLNVFDSLEQMLGGETFSHLFGVILTDRGHEFARFEELERSCLGVGDRCHIYYADPYRADQKGAIENAHLFIRRILPKKTSFESMDAWKAALLMSHINSAPRQSLGGLCPLDFAVKVFPQGFLEEMGIEKVTADDVCLKPNLLTKK